MSGLRRLLRHRELAIGAVLAGALLVVSSIGPFLVGDPLARDIDHGLTELGAPLAPSSSALLGTDHLGRDVWARIVAGTGTSLGIAAIATLIALLIGTSIGLVAGYARGRVDDLLMRLVDLALAFPLMLLAILLAALLRESPLAGSSAPVIIALSFVGWTTIARVTRGKALILARSEMVVAARAIGATPSRIVLRYMLPNIAGLAIALFALGFAQNLLAESVLSFLGLGPPPFEPTWGRMLWDGRIYYRTAPHLVVAPALAIVLAVVSFQLLAEGLRRAFDPEARR